MNQILDTTKIYVTPELLKKKNFYKLAFLISVFLVCILFSYYIYAEFDRNNKEQIGTEMLVNARSQIAEVRPVENDSTLYNGNAILVIMRGREWN